MADDAVLQQADYRVRFGWGPNDTALLSPLSDLVVIVDVLRFTTAVTVAVEQGAIVYPYRWRDASAGEFAASVDAALADGTDRTGPSLCRSRCAATAGVVSIIAAGERWGDASLRPCLEDMLGAGAFLAALPADELSPESLAAVPVFEAARPSLESRLMQCGSGRSSSRRVTSTTS